PIFAVHHEGVLMLAGPERHVYRPDTGCRGRRERSPASVPVVEVTDQRDRGGPGSYEHELHDLAGRLGKGWSDRRVGCAGGRGCPRGAWPRGGGGPASRGGEGPPPHPGGVWRRRKPRLVAPPAPLGVAPPSAGARATRGAPPAALPP